MTYNMSSAPGPCTCGHAPEEHGRDPKYPGSTACTQCDCIAYDEAPEEDDDSDQHHKRHPDEDFDD